MGTSSSKPALDVDDESRFHVVASDLVLQDVSSFILDYGSAADHKSDGVQIDNSNQQTHHRFLTQSLPQKRHSLLYRFNFRHRSTGQTWTLLKSTSDMIKLHRSMRSEFGLGAPELPREIRLIMKLRQVGQAPQGPVIARKLRSYVNGCLEIPNSLRSESFRTFLEISRTTFDASLGKSLKEGIVEISSSGYYLGDTPCMPSWQRFYLVCREDSLTLYETNSSKTPYQVVLFDGGTEIQANFHKATQQMTYMMSGSSCMPSSELGSKVLRLQTEQGVMLIRAPKKHETYSCELLSAW
jgi:hypothetical protein